jgi:uncharacterized protein
MEPCDNFLGQGWSFPPSFDPNTGTASMSCLEDNIRENIWAIVTTAPGERVMRPDFGCDMQGLMFEEIKHSLKRDITTVISKSLLLYEPRIKVNAVNPVTDEETYDRVLVYIDYTIKATNSRKNIVYPFYLFEGKGV